MYDKTKNCYSHLYNKTQYCHKCSIRDYCKESNMPASPSAYQFRDSDSENVIIPDTSTIEFVGEESIRPLVYDIVSLVSFIVESKDVYGKIIKTALSNHELTLREMAVITGQSHVTVSNVLNKAIEKAPALKNLLRVNNHGNFKEIK